MLRFLDAAGLTGFDWSLSMLTSNLVIQEWEHSRARDTSVARECWLKSQMSRVNYFGIMLIAPIVLWLSGNAALILSAEQFLAGNLLTSHSLTQSAWWKNEPREKRILFPVWHSCRKPATPVLLSKEARLVSFTDWCVNVKYRMPLNLTLRCCVGPPDSPLSSRWKWVSRRCAWKIKRSVLCFYHEWSEMLCQQQSEKKRLE